jgi:hypothetical protein
MAETTGGITASIRRKLQEGRTPEEIVQELVAGGLGQASAQRFVDRARAENATATPLPPPTPDMSDAPKQADALDQFIQTRTAETEAENAKTGRAALWIGSLLMCSGIVITAVSYIMAGPGERYRLMWGPVAFGFIVWGQSVFKGFARARTFAWFSAVASIVVPLVLTVIMLGVVAASEPAEDDPNAQAAEVLRSMNTPEEKNAAITKSYKDEFEARRANLDVDGLLALWDEAGEKDEPDETRLKCDFAMQMAVYTGEHRQWLANELVSRIDGASDQAKICNARAALVLDWDTGAAVYRQWQNGDNTRLKSAAANAMKPRTR